MMTGHQCRAARAWLGLEARELARIARCNRDTLRRFEGGAGLRPATAAVIRAELERRGIVFVFGRDGAAVGIEAH